jgi:hypothetical protein
MATAERLSTRLEGVRAELEQVNRYGRRSRHIIWGLSISLVVDILLTVLISVVAVQANNASNTAGNAFASNQALCKATNTSRHQQVALWTYLIDLSLSSNPKPRTAKQKAAQARSEALLAKFERHLRAVFAPRNCANLTGK